VVFDTAEKNKEKGWNCYVMRPTPEAFLFVEEGAKCLEMTWQ
jgi:hypothetical protein